METNKWFVGFLIFWWTVRHCDFSVESPWCDPTGELVMTMARHDDGPPKWSASGTPFCKWLGSHEGIQQHTVLCIYIVLTIETHVYNHDISVYMHPSSCKSFHHFQKDQFIYHIICFQQGSISCLISTFLHATLTLLCSQPVSRGDGEFDMEVFEFWIVRSTQWVVSLVRFFAAGGLKFEEAQLYSKKVCLHSIYIYKLLYVDIIYIYICMLTFGTTFL